MTHPLQNGNEDEDTRLLSLQKGRNFRTIRRGADLQGAVSSLQHHAWAFVAAMDNDALWKAEDSWERNALKNISDRGSCVGGTARWRITVWVTEILHSRLNNSGRAWKSNSGTLLCTSDDSESLGQ